jgi:hypothetical protein
MVLGEKLWEGTAKSAGAGSIKSVGAEGVISEYSWSAQMTGMGRAKGIDGSIHVTAVGKMPSKGVATEKEQGVFMTMSGDRGVLKGFSMMKMMMGGNPKAVGLWSFMAMSEKLSWMNELIALVTYEAQDPMWMESKITICEWK